MASLVATAKLNGVEPLAWLTNVLERLLPWAWQAERLAVAFHA